ncbi:ribosomal protection-like ABC-F family protein [Paenibacillus methanolicus]|uniref:ATPase subunit of ABC transporter with duplicated ATPase domains n=1 Tax=Paenibacillus methanolicus TaxID=582686 RepID=A0A5S5C7W1_9BACL|nr:ABC-F family ATP-binding cassette domain-containing protein [Paenibacillus methanolicus]TYP75491.1 ATPase subunit of ABC transporter with duplicated ATPase domains [Paenibacillus methanolicus]
MTLIINSQQAKKYHGAQLVLENATFDIHDGERIGLVGRNGSGKSTLMRLIAKAEKPDEGQLTVRKDASIGYLAQIPAEWETRTVYDALAFGFQALLECREQMRAIEAAMSDPAAAASDGLDALLGQYAKAQERFEQGGGYELDARIDAVASGLRIDRAIYARQFGTLSGGEKTKIGLASLLVRRPELLLLDEPTNHLDMAGIEWLESYLKQYNGACLIVSHDRTFLDRVVAKIIDLEDGETTVYHGNYTWYAREKEERLLRQFAEFQEQQKQIKKMKETIRQLEEWGRVGGNEKFFRRAASMQKALDRMEKLKRPVLERRGAAFDLRQADRSGSRVLHFEGVRKAYGGKQVLRGADGLLEYGERVMLLGGNGAGKSTLVKLMLGLEQADSGVLHWGSRVDIGYLAQQEYPEDGKRSVLAYFREEAGLEEGEARARLAKYLFYGADVFKQVGQLSGGEWTRLRLALLVLRKPNVLILDEPTNHMDIASKEALEEALDDYQGTLLAITHDRYFINRLAEKVWVLEQGRISAYLGGYDDYEAERGRRKAQETGEADTAGAGVLAARESGGGKTKAIASIGERNGNAALKANDGVAMASGQGEGRMRAGTNTVLRARGADGTISEADTANRDSDAQSRVVGGAGATGRPERRSKPNPALRERLEREIAQTEERLARLDETLNDGKVLGDHAETARLWAQRVAEQQELDRLYERWMALETLEG